MDYRLHRLGKTDLTLMRSLNKLFGEVFENQENYQSNLPSDSYLSAFLADEGDEAMDFYKSLNPSEDILTRNFDFEVKQ